MSLGIQPYVNLIWTVAISLVVVATISFLLAHSVGGASRKKRQTVFMFASIVGLAAIMAYVSLYLPASS